MTNEIPDENDEIWSRITRVLAGDAQAGDEPAVTQWVEASPKNRAMLEQLRRHWQEADAAQRVRAGEEARSEQSPTFLIRIVAMAVLFLLFALAWKWGIKRR